MTSLLPLSGDDVLCVKCGNQGAGYEYHPYCGAVSAARLHIMGAPLHDEFVARECSRCRYAWAEDVARFPQPIMCAKCSMPRIPGQACPSCGPAVMRLTPSPSCARCEGIGLEAGPPDGVPCRDCCLTMEPVRTPCETCNGLADLKPGFRCSTCGLGRTS